MSTHDTAKSFGYGFRKTPRVKFVKGGTEQSKPSTETRPSSKATGAEISRFYRSLNPSRTPESTIPITDEPYFETCTTCGLQIKGSQKEHVMSTAHLTSHKHQKAPLNPLHISRTSFGFQHLETLGWTHLQERGLGVEGNQGPREPIKASRVKNDTIGLGVKRKKRKTKEIKTMLPQGDIVKRYKREMEKRRALLHYMHRV
ncbi:hypothetical protein NEOLI_002153 [Neolecta irregularis DAH-3]|uniref:G-patch domain-containing protein n=1 Tax=Neolecta irregularis (strain DAH-3) TaxID=1198029 RepID=A0A1U7LSI2_NEOID|nr:hypothetical protein NEOLI_002153 [Neolecta irregularis DAH-3]|eukprot:OLL25502.1 hypothetical protein NEOLI_002153 [Neolecta irregularis DAH-3]